jgi:hypothetical protein
MLLGATEPVDGEAMDEGLRQGNVLSEGFSSFGPSVRDELYIIFVSADPVRHGMAAPECKESRNGRQWK